MLLLFAVLYTQPGSTPPERAEPKPPTKQELTRSHPRLASTLATFPKSSLPGELTCQVWGLTLRLRASENSVLSRYRFPKRNECVLKYSPLSAIASQVPGKFCSPCDSTKNAVKYLQMEGTGEEGRKGTPASPFAQAHEGLSHWSLRLGSRRGLLVHMRSAVLLTGLVFDATVRNCLYLQNVEGRPGLR